MLTLLAHHEIASLHPDDATPSVHRVIVAQIHNALVEQDENLEFQPVLAKALPEASANGLTWTFQLREGVKFHNGVEFTSADVKYTYEWYINNKDALFHQFFEGVAAVETPDAYAVVVRLSAPNAAFFVQVADTFIVPADYHEAVGKDAYGAAPIGTGAFKLKEWRSSEFTEVERFDEHFRGAPYLDGVRMDVVPEAAVRALGLETGDADSSVWPLVTEDNLRLAADTNRFTTFVTSSLLLNQFALNNTHPVLSDKRVRQAMMFAIDRQAIIEDLFLGAAKLATANLSPALGDYYNPNVPQYSYDPDQAAALLDDAGWELEGDVRTKDGRSLSFTCTTISGDSIRRQEAETVQQYLAQVGIDMALNDAPLATIAVQLRAGQMDCSVFNYAFGGDQGDPDATATLLSGASNNFSHFENAEVDELLHRGLEERDTKNRIAIYHRIQEIVADEVPFLFMMFWDWYEIFNTRVHGLPATSRTDAAIYSKAYQWWKA